MKPGWVEFAPVWGRPSIRLTDGYSEETIARVFALAMQNLRGEASDFRTQIQMSRLKKQLEEKVRE